MTKEEMIMRYMELYDNMVLSKDPKKMHVFGESEKYVYKVLADKNPELAESWLSHLESTCWNNYLSETEAMNISKRIINQDGSKGFHWDYKTFIGAVKSLGGMVEDRPYYNTYALCATANMIYSDHANSIAVDLGYKTPNETPNEKMAMSCYRKAVENLKDVDNKDFVRNYFKHKMYNDSPMPS